MTRRRKVRFFDLFPPWLVSFVFHAILLLLLGMWMVPGGPAPAITLSTTIGPEDRLGEELIWEQDPLAALEQPDIEPYGLELPNPMEWEGNITVDLPTEPLLPGEEPGSQNVLDALPPAPTPAMQPGGALSGRDPAVRRAIALQQGGTDETEAAVALGLAWLARHQNADGSWSLDRFHLAPKASSKTGMGFVSSDTAATALALMAFLGAGQTHRQGKYRETVASGLRWLTYQQQSNGDLRGRGSGRMYAHGLAAIVLCEAYAMTNDPWLRLPAQRAVDFIVAAQHPAGGWRYEPGQAGDTSVVGWQLMALQSARMHYLLYVPEETLRRASSFLDSVKHDYNGGTYGYLPGSHATPAMTAQALLSRLYLGWPTTHRGVRAGVQWLLSEHLPNIDNPNIYYWYYGTQLMHHVGGTAFRRWNYVMRPILLEMQHRSGPDAGSWPPTGAWATEGGRLFMTALAVCTLEVYYRHMPLNKEDAVKVGQLIEASSADKKTPGSPSNEAPSGGA